MDIESADVIRLVQQFLKEHNLHRALEALQEETGVMLNTVDSIDAFKDDIVKGHWDVVLTNVEHANIPHAKLVDLYEQIVIELVELQDIGPARALLRQTEPMEIMRRNQPERYLKLEKLLSQNTPDSSINAYRRTEGNQARRLKIAQKLVYEVNTAPPNRLLTLLGQAIKWQQQKEGLVVAEGVPFDLFYGKSLQPLQPSEDRMPDKHLATIKFPKKQHPNSLVFSTKGNYLATGSADGFIEIWNFMTGKLASDLKYQADGSLMMMEEAVTSLSISYSGDLVCSGAKDGKIRVWKVKTGSCYKRFLAAHSKEVTCVCFSHDDTQILSGGYDNILRIHGLKSGNMLKEFRGHSAGITSAAFSQDMSLVLSTSEDGTLRIWDSGSAACLHTVTPGSDKIGLSIPTVSSVMPVPGSLETFVVCTKSPSIYIVSSKGFVEKTLMLKEEYQCKELLAAAVSPQGKYVMAVSDKSVLHCFSIETGEQLEECHKITDVEIVGMASHPFLNVAAFFSNDRRVPIWASLKDN
ncbi:hypothetical protein LPJ64_002150 [Coemansia asiatica]|uniref:WD40 repeat-containing protein SMU1 n=1 Tax=Coemansia asiatica TaxID=1052880 RepID=A0A9W7XM47_9FUNG|nr:hypothetical protein LPJ64_002150 [Coemansia asiatica]